jgi:DNA mismatch repair protein MutS
MGGAGSNMYGLEVCKSLHMPDDFLNRANHIRMKYNEESAGPLSFKQSHFNAQKLMGICEMCKGKRGQEVHHISEQARADEDGYILHEDGTVYHKNRRFNLMSLCESCHKEIHRNQKKNNIAHV